MSSSFSSFTISCNTDRLLSKRRRAHFLFTERKFTERNNLADSASLSTPETLPYPRQVDLRHLRLRPRREKGLIVLCDATLARKVTGPETLNT